MGTDRGMVHIPITKSSRCTPEVLDTHITKLADALQMYSILISPSLPMTLSQRKYPLLISPSLPMYITLGITCSHHQACRCTAEVFHTHIANLADVLQRYSILISPNLPMHCRCIPYSYHQAYRCSAEIFHTHIIKLVCSHCMRYSRVISSSSPTHCKGIPWVMIVVFTAEVCPSNISSGLFDGNNCHNPAYFKHTLWDQQASTRCTTRPIPYIK